jgi:hypothetical protein
MSYAHIQYVPNVVLLRDTTYSTCMYLYSIQQADVTWNLE